MTAQAATVTTRLLVGLIDTDECTVPRRLYS